TEALMAPAEIERAQRVAADQSGHEYIGEHPDEVVGEVFDERRRDGEQRAQQLPSESRHHLPADVQRDRGAEETEPLARELMQDRARVVVTKQQRDDGG